MAMRKALLFVSLIFVAIVVLATTATFSFYQESLSQAFVDVSESFNVPIVVDETVSGQVTMALNNVTFKGAIDDLCAKFDLFYFEKNGVYFVGSSSSSVMMKVYGYSTHVIPLKYLSANDAIKFLAPYTSYITYASGSGILLFRGPKEIYSKVAKIIKNVDKVPNTSYIVYALYSVPSDFYTSGNNSGWLSKLVNTGNFSSVDAKQFTSVKKSFIAEENGFAFAQSGKTVSFDISDMKSKLDATVMSQSASGAKINLSLSSSGLVNVAANSVLTIRKNDVVLAALRNGEQDFVIEVSVVKTSPSISKLAKMWPIERKVRSFYLKANISTSEISFEVLARYLNIAADVEKTASNASIYAGIGEKIAQNLWGYLLAGSNVPIKSLDSYKVKFVLVQTENSNGFILSSGSLSLAAPLKAFNEFKLNYSGTVEMRFDTLLLGVNMQYSYDNTNGEQSFDSFLTGGYLLNGNVVRVMYGPLSKEFRFELEWGM